MMTVMFSLLAAQCGASCPLPPASSAPAVPLEALVEVVSDAGVLVHRARGPLVLGKKVHLGGSDLRKLGYDAPDYEINSRMITPEKVWTST